MKRVTWATGKGQAADNLYVVLKRLKAESAFLYTNCELSDILAAINVSDLKRRCSIDGWALVLEMALHRERAGGISGIESDSGRQRHY